MKSSRETKKQIEYNDLNHDFIQRQQTVRLKSFVFCITDVAIWAEWGIKVLKSSYWAQLQALQTEHLAQAQAKPKESAYYNLAIATKSRTPTKTTKEGVP